MHFSRKHRMHLFKDKSRGCRCHSESSFFLKKTTHVWSLNYFKSFGVKQCRSHGFICIGRNRKCNFHRTSRLNPKRACARSPHVLPYPICYWFERVCLSASSQRRLRSWGTLGLPSRFSTTSTLPTETSRYVEKSRWEPPNRKSAS